MTSGEAWYLVLVVAGFVAFAGTLAFASWDSKPTEGRR